MKSLAPIISLILLAFFSGSVALAQPNTTGGGNPNTTGSQPDVIGIRITNPLKGNGNIIELFNSVIDNVLLPIGAMLVVLAFIWVGFMFVTSQGNEEKLKVAKRYLLYAVIGAVILLGARVLGELIVNTINTLKSG